MPNPAGKNGHSLERVRIYNVYLTMLPKAHPEPPPEELRAALLDYASKQLPLQSRIVRLQKEFDYHIGLTKLKKLNKTYEIPSVRKPPPYDQVNQLVFDKVAHDSGQYSGPDAICTKIALDGVPLPRRMVRQVMHENWDDGFDHRFPGGKKRQRGHLTAFGPWQEGHGDGHAKLDAAALRMGGVGLPIYCIRDKWTGAPLCLRVLPNDRRAVIIGHFYLDMVEDYHMIPQQLTVDGGTETSEMGAFQLALREQFAPDLSLENFPAFVSLPSTLNIVIEAFWPWLRKDCGLNLYDVITAGHTRGIYNIASPLHADLFNWLWPPIVQEALDQFYRYWVSHCVRKQRNKMMPSGVAPEELYMNPELYGGRPMGIPITNSNVIPALRETLPYTREEAFQWVSNEFAAAAEEVYVEIGSPKLTILSAWDVFVLMVPKLAAMEDLQV